MKRRTLITITVLLSLFLSAIPVRAGAMTGELKKSTQIPATFNASLADIPNTLPDGYHDNFGGAQNQFFCRAEGWAADPDDRSIDLNVKVFSDGVEVTQVVADAFRQDLADARVCTSGTCSFSVNLWGLITPDADHLITVQAQDVQTGEWSNLYDTPKTLNCFTPKAGTFIVNSTADGADANPGDSVCETFTPGECTLRAAMMESNANPGVDTINFAIPGDGPYTISPTYELPPMGDPFILDGTTQPGFAGTPIIELNGSSAGPGVDGLNISAGSSIIRGLVINRFSRDGMVMYINGGNVIQGNYIGTDITGTVNLGNSRFAVFVRSSPNNLIGGTATGQGNLILGSGNHALQISDTGADGNVVQGNFIGTDATGTLALGNPYIGVVIGNGATNNLIGGAAFGARNVISGNAQAGVVIFAAGTTGNQIQGNNIGTNASGTAALANGAGVYISNGAANNTIGGSGTGEGNVISGNTSDAVTIIDTGTSGNEVAGNFIGTDVNGITVLANTGKGVAIFTGATNSLIGGTSSQARNIISGNSDNGVVIYGEGASSNSVQGNYIGTDVSGTLALGNTGSGILIGGAAADNMLGGLTAGAGNLISGNIGNGILIGDVDSTENLIQGNFIGTDVTGTLSLGNTDDGVVLLAPNNIIGGTTSAARNIISGNQEQGVRLQGSEATGNVVQGNFIGIDRTGIIALANGTDCCHSGVVLHLGASNNTIGGITPGAGNVISGNTADGVTIIDTGTTGNIVAGNFIGTDLNGIAGIANASSGVAIYSGATDNLVGGTTAAARNVISGNGGPGVNICCDGVTRNSVKGNFIGTDVGGTLALGNVGDGVSIYQSADNTIGGMEAGARNLISGNQSHGIGIYDAGTTGNLVQGNYVGTDVTGMIAVGNSLDGIVICCGGASGNTIGGTALGAGNLISGNDGSGIGIYDDTTANLVQGNLIGTDATGTGSLGNGANGIGIAGGPTNNTVGGTINGARNIIAFNEANGVSLTADAGTGNVISSNSIYANGSLGIDLGENGVTLNDLFDADSGPNNLQNFPVITAVKNKGKGITVQGTLISTGDSTFQIQVFSSNSCDPSGYGEGQTYLGSASVTTTPIGRAQFKITLQTSLVNGAFITATATDSANNTSEFSQCRQVSP